MSLLSPGAETVAVAEQLRERIARMFRRSLQIRHLDVGSSNGCDWEINALLNPVYDVQRFGIDFVASPRHADLLLVTGRGRATSSRPCGPHTRRRPTRSSWWLSARARAAVALWPTATRRPAGWTAAYPWTCTCRAARRGRKQSSMDC